MKFELSRSKWFFGLGLTIYRQQKEIYIMLAFWLIVITYGKLKAG